MFVIFFFFFFFYFMLNFLVFFFFFQAEDGIRDKLVTGVQTCALPISLVGTLLWVAVSLGFKLYVANFADYNATYGAVGGVIVLLLWFYISGLAILVGEIGRASCRERV